MSLGSCLLPPPGPSLPFGSRTLTNRAVYKGWSGFTTTVQLDAVIEPLTEQANRLAVGFHKAIVNVAGMKVTFPHLQRFRLVPCSVLVIWLAGCRRRPKEVPLFSGRSYKK